MTSASSTGQRDGTAEINCDSYQNPAVISMLLQPDSYPDVTDSYLRNIRSLASQIKGILTDLRITYASRPQPSDSVPVDLIPSFDSWLTLQGETTGHLASAVTALSILHQAMLRHERSQQKILTHTMESKVAQLTDSIMVLDCLLQPLALVPRDLSPAEQILLLQTQQLANTMLRSRRDRHKLQGYVLTQTEELMDFIIDKLHGIS